MHKLNIKTPYFFYIAGSLLCALLSVLGDQFHAGMFAYVTFGLLGLAACAYFITKGKILVPKPYLLLFAAYLVIMAITAYMSPYTMGVKYITIGAVITILPFLVFILSYNFVFSMKTINTIIDFWIYFILSLCMLALLETFVLRTNVYYQTAILKISVIKPGFFASLCNQGTILSLYRYTVSKDRKFRTLAVLLSVCSILTVQLKVILGLLIIWVIYIYMFSSKNKATVGIVMLVTCVLGAIIVVNIPPLYEKILRYTVLYGAVDSYEMVARPALYYQSVMIANDFFPLGSGQGTFGSIPVNIVYNPIYYDYGLSNIHGLGETGDNFKMDTHWSSILGENGYLGTLLYLLLFYYPLSYVRRIGKNGQHKQIQYLMLTVFAVITVESITLCIPGRMAFMFIYSGMTGLIARNISVEKTEDQDS